MEVTFDWKEGQCSKQQEPRNVTFLYLVQSYAPRAHIFTTLRGMTLQFNYPFIMSWDWLDIHGQGKTPKENS